MFNLKNNINTLNLSGSSRQEMLSFLELIDEFSLNREDSSIKSALMKFNKDKLSYLFELLKNRTDIQFAIWRELPEEIVNNPQNFNIFESVLRNTLGDYIDTVDVNELITILNTSRDGSGAVDSQGRVLYMNPSMLEQIQSPLLKSDIVRAVFSFEEIFQILSNKDMEEKLKKLINMPNAENVLRVALQDKNMWKDNLQYLMNMDEMDAYDFMEAFGENGEGITSLEVARRKELFRNMEIGYYEDEEYGEVDCSFSVYGLLRSTFGISFEEAKELVKKYGTDLEKISPKTDEEKVSYRKLQIIKDLVTRDFEDYDAMMDYCRNFYYTNQQELHQLSEEVSPFYKVNLERNFLDLYAHQYDQSLGVEASRVEDVTYNGNNIPVYEVTGDFTIFIRGEQNVSPESEKNFWDQANLQIQGKSQSTISQEYIRTVMYDADDVCFVASTSCGEGELRLAASTNIKAKEANVALSNVGIDSTHGNGIVFRTLQEQINNSRGTNNEVVTSMLVHDEKSGLSTKKPVDYVVYIQETNDTDITQDPRFETAQFAASQMGVPILIIPREKCAQRECEKLQVLKDKLLGKAERLPGETDETIIREMVTKFNNNREGILSSAQLREKYFTEGEHLELLGAINTRLSQLKEHAPEQYALLQQAVGEVYRDEIEKYYAFSYDRDDARRDLDIDLTREHVRPYEDFIIAQERPLFDISRKNKKNIDRTIESISQTPYYDMNQYHSLEHVKKVVMFSGILAQNEGLSEEETQMLLAAAAFHDSGRSGSEGDFDNHAIASAEQIERYFEEHPKNSFGITKENLPLIQAAIEYHEHIEPEKGKIDRFKLDELMRKYNIDYDDMESLEKISMLLKDADALDRSRFGKRNENSVSLDARHLKSDTARTFSMIRFTESCNLRLNERGEEVPQDGFVEKIMEEELGEFARPKIPKVALRQVTEEVDVSEKMNLMQVIRNMCATVKKAFTRTKEER